MYSKYCGVPKQEIDACPTVRLDPRLRRRARGAVRATFYGPAIVPTNNSNWGQVNDPQINSAMVAASLVVNPTQRAQAWANVDKMLVQKAVAVPEEWDNQPNIRSRTSPASTSCGTTESWDFTFTSLK